MVNDEVGKKSYDTIGLFYSTLVLLLSRLTSHIRNSEEKEKKEVIADQIGLGGEPSVWYSSGAG